MPEGHTLHRLAKRHLDTFGGHVVHVTSPQGRFAAGAARLDGAALLAAQAHGKHIFLGFGSLEPPPGRVRPRADRWLHVHLGLYGTWVFGTGTPPPARGALRLRMESDEAWADLRGPTACELITEDEVGGIRGRLGADPLRKDADPEAAGRRIMRSATPIGALLMQQDVVAGIGNVYRAEVLYRHRIDPWMAGRELAPEQWRAMWERPRRPAPRRRPARAHRHDPAGGPAAQVGSRSGRARRTTCTGGPGCRASSAGRRSWPSPWPRAPSTGARSASAAPTTPR